MKYSDADPTDISTDIEKSNEADLSWLYKDDEDYPPEYSLKQQSDFDELGFANEVRVGSEHLSLESSHHPLSRMSLN